MFFWGGGGIFNYFYYLIFDIHGTVYQDIIYENDQKDATV
jgi:hypothetical protein